MSRPLITYVDVQTGESITREMNDEEYNQYLLDKEETEKKIAEDARIQEEANTIKTALQEKLYDLGLNEEIIDLIKKIY